LAIDAREEATAFSIAIAFIAFSDRLAITRTILAAIEIVFCTIQVEGLCVVRSIVALTISIELVDIGHIIAIAVQALARAAALHPDAVGLIAFSLERVRTASIGFDTAAATLISEILPARFKVAGIINDHTGLRITRVFHIGIRLIITTRLTRRLAGPVTIIITATILRRHGVILSTPGRNIALIGDIASGAADGAVRNL